MIEILKNLELNTLPSLFEKKEIWNAIDIKKTNPRTYYLWTKYNDYYISFSKTFFCNDSEINSLKAKDNIIIHFLDGFWEIVIDGKKLNDDDNYALLDEEADFNKKTFLIEKNINYSFRSNSKRNWVYSISISKTEHVFEGNILKLDIKESLLKSAKILIFQ